MQTNCPQGNQNTFILWNSQCPLDETGIGISTNLSNCSRQLTRSHVLPAQNGQKSYGWRVIASNPNGMTRQISSDNVENYHGPLAGTQTHCVLGQGPEQRTTQSVDKQLLRHMNPQSSSFSPPVDINHTVPVQLLHSRQAVPFLGGTASLQNEKSQVLPAGPGLENRTGNLNDLQSVTHVNPQFSCFTNPIDTNQSFLGQLLNSRQMVKHQVSSESLQNERSQVRSLDGHPAECHISAMAEPNVSPVVNANRHMHQFSTIYDSLGNAVQPQYAYRQGTNTRFLPSNNLQSEHSDSSLVGPKRSQKFNSSASVERNMRQNLTSQNWKTVNVYHGHWNKIASGISQSEDIQKKSTYSVSSRKGGSPHFPNSVSGSQSLQQREDVQLRALERAKNITHGPSPPYCKPQQFFSGLTETSFGNGFATDSSDLLRNQPVQQHLSATIPSDVNKNHSDRQMYQKELGVPLSSALTSASQLPLLGQLSTPQQDKQQKSAGIVAPKAVAVVTPLSLPVSTSVEHVSEINKRNTELSNGRCITDNQLDHQTTATCLLPTGIDQSASKHLKNAAKAVHTDSHMSLAAIAVQNGSTEGLDRSVAGISGFSKHSEPSDSLHLTSLNEPDRSAQVFDVENQASAGVSQEEQSMGKDAVKNQNKEMSINDFSDSIPFFEWSYDKLQWLISMFNHHENMKRSSKNDVSATDVADEILRIYWDGDYKKLVDAGKSSLYPDIMKNVHEYCGGKKSVILRQVRKNDWGRLAERCHILRHGDEAPKMVYTSSSWLNVNELLEDIDKEHGYPLILRFSHSAAKAEEQAQMAQDENTGNSNSDIVVQSETATTSEVLSPAVTTEQCASETQSILPELPTATVIPLVEDENADVDCTDPLSNIEITVLSPETAKALFSNEYVNLEDLRMDSPEQHSKDNEEQAKVKLSDEISKGEEQMMANVELIQNKAEKKSRQVRDYCCLAKWIQDVCGNEGTLINKCQCKAELEPNNEIVNICTLNEGVVSLEEKTDEADADHSENPLTVKCVQPITEWNCSEDASEYTVAKKLPQSSTAEDQSFSSNHSTNIVEVQVEEVFSSYEDVLKITMSEPPCDKAHEQELQGYVSDVNFDSKNIKVVSEQQNFGSPVVSRNSDVQKPLTLSHCSRKHMKRQQRYSKMEGLKLKQRKRLREKLRADSAVSKPKIARPMCTSLTGQFLDDASVSQNLTGDTGAVRSESALKNEGKEKPAISHDNTSKDTVSLVLFGSSSQRKNGAVMTSRYLDQKMAQIRVQQCNISPPPTTITIKVSPHGQKDYSIGGSPSGQTAKERIMNAWKSSYVASKKINRFSRRSWRPKSLKTSDCNIHDTCISDSSTPEKVMGQSPLDPSKEVRTYLVHEKSAQELQCRRAETSQLDKSYVSAKKMIRSAHYSKKATRCIPSPNKYKKYKSKKRSTHTLGRSKYELGNPALLPMRDGITLDFKVLPTSFHLTEDDHSVEPEKPGSSETETLSSQVKKFDSMKTRTWKVKGVWSPSAKMKNTHLFTSSSEVPGSVHTFEEFKRKYREKGTVTVAEMSVLNSV